MRKATIARARELRRLQSDAEKFFWSKVRNRRLNDWKFKRQVPIGPYIADFYVDAVKAVVELDGGQHGDDLQYAKDRVRDDYFQANGYAVIRYWNTDFFKDPDSVLDHLARKLNELAERF